MAELYCELMKDSLVVLPQVNDYSTHVFHQFTILTDERDEIMSALSEQNIASAIYYPIPLHQQKVFADQYQGLELPVTESISQRCLSLPIFPEMTDEQVERVAMFVSSKMSG